MYILKQFKTFKVLKPNAHFFQLTKLSELACKVSESELHGASLLHGVILARCKISAQRHFNTEGHF